MNAIQNHTAEARLFVPGRLCLMGEHSDWAAQSGYHRGYCLVVGTDQGLDATARPDEQFRVDTALPAQPDGRPAQRRTMICPWRCEDLRRAAEDRAEFFRYCAGAAWVMKQTGRVEGLNLSIDRMDLPLKKGVSSSAAVCVMVVSAFNQVYNLGLFPHEIMELAYQGERLTGSQCGRMDQACIFGKTPVLVTFGAGEEIRVEPVSAGGEMSMLLIDLAGQKDTVTILSDLRAAHQRDESLRRALGPDNEQMVRRAYQSLTVGDAEQLGAWMTEAQRLFDRQVATHCPAELASPLLHGVLELPEIQPHVYGGKGVGSQGDGTAQLVTRSPADRDRVVEILAERFPQMRSFELTIVPAHRGRVLTS